MPTHNSYRIICHDDEYTIHNGEVLRFRPEGIVFERLASELEKQEDMSGDIVAFVPYSNLKFFYKQQSPEDIRPENTCEEKGQEP